MAELNKIHHKNAFELLQEMEDQSVDFVLTDIPYLISRETNFKGIKNYTRKSDGETDYCAMKFGEWDKEFDVDFYVSECCRILKPSRSLIIWAAWQQLQQIDLAIKAALGKQTGSSRIGIWEKTNPSVFNMQRMAIQPFEFFIWNRKGKNWTFNNQRQGKAETHHFRHCCIAGGHPTAKPLDIFKHLIRTYTNEDDVVFDGVVGGGTTAIAAALTKRQFICSELDTEHYKMAEEALQIALQNKIDMFD